MCIQYFEFTSFLGKKFEEKRAIAYIRGAFVFTCKLEVNLSREWPRVQKEKKRKTGDVLRYTFDA